MEYRTKTAQETFNLGEKLATRLTPVKHHATVIGLHGELGAGKTTFVQGFGCGLGIKDRILSPTFILMREYPLTSPFSRLVHIDLYRINQPFEVESLGLKSLYADSSLVVLIEWIEKGGNYIPSPLLDIFFTIENEGRKIEWKE